MKISRIVMAAALAGGLMGALAPAQAADEVNVVPGLSIAGAPLALHGYDPVAYFKAGKPTRVRFEQRDGAKVRVAVTTGEVLSTLKKAR